MVCPRRKIRITAEPVKVTGDATILFPLIVSQTFAKDADVWGREVSETVCWVDDLPNAENATIRFFGIE
jgi:Deoxyhypusine synthase